MNKEKYYATKAQRQKEPQWIEKFLSLFVELCALRVFVAKDLLQQEI